MAKVIIAFDRDDTRVGKTIDLDDDQAAVLVNEGRARYVGDENDAKTGARKMTPPGKAAEK
ncbi:hypothetical protein [Amycolatopsis anabasis]|uniref:hypothetical protein n=1 Tax=Amycolatopsis anabasis TaxID=1840409 RepID=UPI00131E5E0F|nr:hypothetical protein [Amycolatopsis anabasis]